MQLRPGHGITVDEVRTDGFRVAEVRHSPALSLHTHAHDTGTLWLLLEGAMSERSGVEIVVQQRMSLAVRPPYRPHENQYHAAGGHSILVDLDPADRRARAVLDATKLDRSQAHNWGVLLARAFSETGSGRRRTVANTVRAILEAISAGVRRRPPAWLERTRELLAERIAEPPSLRELASTVGVHHVHLAQSFQRQWGTTVGAYIRAHRTFRALELIEQGTSLADVATEVGFADQSHMTRVIRAERGAPPGALRPHRAAP